MEKGHATALLVVSRFLSNGMEAVGRADDVSVRTGILLVDLAAESLLKLALRFKKLTVEPDSKFRPLLRQVSTIQTGGASLHYVAELDALRTMRNAVMHAGLAQDVSTARAEAERARRILLRLASDVFGRDLSNLHLAEFVHDDWIRRLLEEGARRHGEGQHLEAAGIAAAVFRTLMAKWAKFNKSVFSLDAEADKRLAEIAATLNSGVYLPDLVRFRAATARASAHIAASGKIDITSTGWGHKRTPEEQAEDARFALDFVSGLALQIEGRIGVSAEPALATEPRSP